MSENDIVSDTPHRYSLRSRTVSASPHKQNEPINPIEEHEVFASWNDSDKRFADAKQEELQKWQSFDVFEEVQDVGQHHLTGRWICTEKVGMNGKIPKARFVVRGFQEKVHIQSDSPTGSKECMRIVLMIAATKNWVLNSLDVTSAFLQGQPINRVVYLKPPLEAGVSGVLWRLKKCRIYINIQNSERT